VWVRIFRAFFFFLWSPSPVSWLAFFFKILKSSSLLSSLAVPSIGFGVLCFFVFFFGLSSCSCLFFLFGLLCPHNPIVDSSLPIFPKPVFLYSKTLAFPIQIWFRLNAQKNPCPHFAVLSQNGLSSLKPGHPVILDAAFSSFPQGLEATIFFSDQLRFREFFLFPPAFVLLGTC